MSLSRKKMETAAEESGWTAYLEDFSVGNNQRDGEEEEEISFSDGPSLQSDAASHAAWKNYYKNKKNNNSSLGGSQNQNILKRLNFKKPNRSNNTKLSDPELEDTASSPVNSPKVSSLKQKENSYMRPEINSGNYMGKEGGFEDYQEMEADDERSSINFAEKSDKDSLKKRGLCVMPLSLFMNYIL